MKELINVVKSTCHTATWVTVHPHVADNIWNKLRTPLHVLSITLGHGVQLAASHATTCNLPDGEERHEVDND